MQAALTAAFLQLPPAAQVTLLSDRFALAQSGEQPMSAWLDLVALLPQTRGPSHAALMGQAQAGLRLLAQALARQRGGRGPGRSHARAAGARTAGPGLGRPAGRGQRGRSPAVRR